MLPVFGSAARSAEISRLPVWRLNLHACETAAKRSPLGWILGEGYYLKKSGFFCLLFVLEKLSKSLIPRGLPVHA